MDFSLPEITYQMLNVLDTAQTVVVAQNPQKYREQESAWIIGEHPSVAKVIAFGVGSAVIHEAVSSYLKNNDYGTAYKVWQTVTICDKGAALYRGYSIGIRIRF